MFARDKICNAFHTESQSLFSHSFPASNVSDPGLLIDPMHVEFAHNVSLTCRAQKTRRSRKSALCSSCSRPIAIMRIS